MPRLQTVKRCTGPRLCDGRRPAPTPTPPPTKIITAWHREHGCSCRLWSRLAGSDPTMLMGKGRGVGGQADMQLK